MKLFLKPRRFSFPRRLLAKFLAVVLALLPAVLFSGCWDYREVENLSIVGGIGVDKGQNGYRYHLTFECMKMTGDLKSGGVQPLIIETDGDTIFDAVRSALNESDRKLYFSHMKVLILSSDIAKEGILPVLDWFNRDAEPRITLQILISKEKTAGEILKLEPEDNQLTSFQISQALLESASYSASTNQVRLFETYNVLNSQDATSLTLPGIETKKEGDVSVPQLAGNAVFSGDRLIGWLDKQSSKFLMFVLGKVHGGLLLTGVHPNDSSVTLEILNCKTSVKPVINGKTITMKIDVNMNAAYAEQNARQNFLDIYPLKTFETSASETLKNGIENVIDLAQQQYSTDIFGFGAKVYQDDPKVWSGLRTDWNKTFPSVKYEVTAEVAIRNTATLAGKKEAD
jgi:spore germination protein KC